MKNTSFTVKPTAPGHDADRGGAAPWPAQNSVLRGAFALRSTCADMLKFAAAALDPSASPLQEALELSFKPLAQINELERTALGWKRNKFGVIYTTGATGGFRCAMYLHPQSKTGVVLMANTQVGGVTGGRAASFDALGGSLLNVVLGTPPLDVPFPSPIAIDADSLTDFAGNYASEAGTPGPSFPIRVNEGRLITEGPGGMEQRLWPLEKDVFFLRTYVAEFRFKRDDEGKVVGCDLSFEGRKGRLQRRED